MNNDTNVWVCQFNVNQYNIDASINSEEFEFFKHAKIYLFKEKAEKPALLKKKEQYFALALELEKASHFFNQSTLVPDKLWVESNNVKLPRKADYIFSINSGGILLNQECADILKQSRIGKNYLTSVQIYSLSTNNLVSEQTFYFLNLYERRTYICNPQSDTENFKKVFDIHRDDIYTSNGFIKNQQLEVDKSALDCDVDLWHDSRLGSHFFISEKLYQALYKSNMIDKFNPHTCKLI